MNPHTYRTTLGGRELILETGRLAKLAGAAVTLRYGDTVLLATAQARSEPSTLDFLPLTVEFEERHYAVGKIPGSFQRREGRPGERAILAARLTDRQIRPLFPKGYRFETQVIITVLSGDPELLPDVLGPIAASAALAVSPIPWEGPTACLRVARVGGELVVNPSVSNMALSDLDLVIAGTADAVMMVEAGAAEVPEEDMVAAIEFGHAALQPVLELIARMATEVGRESQPFVVVEPGDCDLLNELTQEAREGGLREALLTPSKAQRSANVRALRNELIARRVPLTESAEADEQTAVIKALWSRIEKAELRRLILEEDLRADGRGSRTVRPITVDMHPLPRPHGSSIFTRGETQVLGTATLGTERDEIIIDDLTSDSEDRFLLHYNFPPYSTGEVKRMGGQSRREVGHGNLAKRAIRAVLPDYDDFPYVIRVVGDVLESNGSSSMATVCAGTLALMDAGVPIRAPVAGVAMGLVIEGSQYRILTDILGLEDALGDMDFKVCGTAQGVTALQMDIKVGGITPQIMREALAQASEARQHILNEMAAAMPAVRPELAPTAPRILTVKISPDKIGAVIGPGGKNVRELEAMGAKVHVEEDGTVRIYSADAESAETVRARIVASTREARPGDIFDGEVVKITPFGAFVNLFPGQDGMLHISQMSEDRIEMVEEVMLVGDRVTVKVVNVDERGKIDLSRPELEGKVPPRTPRPPREGGGGGRERGRDGGRGRDRDGGGRPPRDGFRGGGEGSRPAGEGSSRPADETRSATATGSEAAPAAERPAPAAGVSERSGEEG